MNGNDKRCCGDFNCHDDKPAGNIPRQLRFNCNQKLSLIFLPVIVVSGHPSPVPLSAMTLTKDEVEVTNPAQL